MRTKIFVISIKDHPRRELFSQVASASSDYFEFFDAHREIQGDLTYRLEEARVRMGRPLSETELACYSSHFATWQWLKASTFEQMLVLEDDVVADWAFINMLCSQNLAAMGIQYLKLFSKIPPASWKTVSSPFLDLYYHLIQITSSSLGAQGYFLTRAGAERLVNSGNRVDAPIDVLMDRYWETKLPILAIHPAPLFERYKVSSIGDNRFGRANLSPSEKISRLAWRVKGRFYRELETRAPLARGLRRIAEGQRHIAKGHSGT